jgi:hypothetical protein
MDHFLTTDYQDIHGWEEQKQGGADSLCECWMCCVKDTCKRAFGCFLKTSPSLAGQAQPPIFLPKIPARSTAGPYAWRMSDVFLQSRASSLVEGFEKATPVWLVKAQPCFPLPLCFIRVHPNHPWFLLVTLQAS